MGKLPIGPRTAAFGKALIATPYASFTLEIHDTIEAPSVNIHSVDCWTFSQTALAMPAYSISLPRNARPRRSSVSSSSTAVAAELATVATALAFITWKNGPEITTNATSSKT